MWIQLAAALTLAIPQGAPEAIPLTVVDGTNGEPIAGAEVFAIEESLRPAWGDFWSTYALRTDPDGAALVPVRTDAKPYSWIIIRAEGYGAKSATDELEVMHRQGTEELRIELMPETPITVELLDFTGAPLPLAHLGITIGCGHTPDMVTATTGFDGRAELRGLYDYDGGIKDFFVVHPEVSRRNYSHIPMDNAVDGVVTAYAEPASVLRGVLLHLDGSPAPGYAVGYNWNHRGPWAITDSRGEFELFGFERGRNYLQVRDEQGEFTATFKGAREGLFRTLVLDGTDQPEEFVDGEEGTDLQKFGIRFELAVEGGEAPGLREFQRPIHVEVWDPQTGMCFPSETNTKGTEELWVPAGNYMVEIGATGTPFAAMGLGQVTVGPDAQRHLGPPEAPSVVIKQTLPTPRLITVQVSDVQPDDTVYLTTVYGEEDFETSTPGVVLSDDGTLYIEDYAVPVGRLGAHILRTDSRTGITDRIQLRADDATRRLATWSWAPIR